MQRKVEFEFSSGLRWTHWIRAFAIFLLVVTGFYLAYVFIEPKPSAIPDVFLNAKMRMWHQIIGFILIAATMFKSYLFLFAKTSKKERISILDFFSITIWIQQIKFYLFMGPHPKLRGVYNPLQFISYVGFYMVLFTIILTGLVLYIHLFHEGLGGALYNILRPFEVLMGGIANVREIHHIAMWIIMIFVPVHVYMAIFNSIMSKEGSVDSIVSGYKFIHEDNHK